MFAAIKVATSPSPAGITVIIERAGYGDMANTAKLKEYKRLTLITGFGIASSLIIDATEKAPIIAPNPKSPIKSPKSLEFP